jgi:hypothetical protein
MVWLRGGFGMVTAPSCCIVHWPDTAFPFASSFQQFCVVLALM